MALDNSVKVTIQPVVNSKNLHDIIQAAASKGSAIRLEKFSVNSKNIHTAIADALSGVRSGSFKLQNVKITFDKDALKSLQTKLDSKPVKLTIGSIDASKAVANLRSQLQTMLKGLGIEGLGEALSGGGDVGGAVKNLREIAQKSAEAEAAIRKLSDAQKTLSALNKKSAGITDKQLVTEVRQAYDELAVSIEKSKAAAKSGGFDNQEVQAAVDTVRALQDKVAAYEAAAAAQKKSASASNDVANAEKKAAQDATRAANLNAQAFSIEQRALAIRLQNTRAVQEYGSQLDAVIAKVRDESGTYEQRRQRLAEANAELKKYIAYTQQAGGAGTSILRYADGLANRVKELFSAAAIAGIIINRFREMYTAVKEVDAAMTELKKVSDLSFQGYINYGERAAEIAHRIGAELSDTINATADFARLGYSVPDATELAEAALVYKNVGDGIDSIRDSTEMLISSMKAFGVEADDAMSIVDKFNEVGNRYAISSKGIGEALSNSAAALAAAGNTIDQSIGLVTAMNEVVQDPTKVGTSLKTMTMYLRAAKTAAEEAGIETDGMAESVSKLRGQIESLTGVDIMIDDKTFKSTYDIVKEISAVWGSLSDVTQANVLNLMGGKRNANVIAALISNFQQAEAAATTAMNSIGSATKENEKYLDSIAGRMSQLQASFQQLANTIISSNIVKVIIQIADAFTRLLVAMDKLHLVLPAFGSIIAIMRQMGQAQNTMSLFNQIQMLAASGNTASEIFGVLGGKLSALNGIQRNYLNTLLQSNAGMQEGSTAAAGVAAALSGVGAAAGNTGSKMSLLGASIKNLFSSWQGWFLAITAAISIVTGIVENHKRAVQESIENADKIASEYQEAEKTYADNVKQLEKMREEYEKLASGVKENGENAGLTSEEYARFNQLLEQIESITPGVVSGFTQQADATDKYTGAISRATEALDELLTKEAERVVAGGADLFSGVREEVKQVGDEMTKLQSGFDIFNTRDFSYDLLNGGFDFENDPLVEALKDREKAVAEYKAVVEKEFTEIYGTFDSADVQDQVDAYRSYLTLMQEQYDKLVASRKKMLTYATAYARVNLKEMYDANVPREFADMFNQELEKQLTVGMNESQVKSAVSNFITTFGNGIRDGSVQLKKTTDSAIVDPFIESFERAQNAADSFGNVIEEYKKNLEAIAALRAAADATDSNGKITDDTYKYIEGLAGATEYLEDDIKLLEERNSLLLQTPGQAIGQALEDAMAQGSTATEEQIALLETMYSLWTSISESLQDSALKSMTDALEVPDLVSVVKQVSDINNGLAQINSWSKSLDSKKLLDSNELKQLISNMSGYVDVWADILNDESINLNTIEGQTAAIDRVMEEASKNAVDLLQSYIDSMHSVMSSDTFDTNNTEAYNNRIAFAQNWIDLLKSGSGFVALFGEETDKASEATNKMTATLSSGLENLKSFADIYKTVTSSDTSFVDIVKNLDSLAEIMNKLDGGSRTYENFIMFDEATGKWKVNLGELNVAFSEIVSANDGLVASVENGTLTMEMLGKAFMGDTDAADKLIGAVERLSNSLKALEGFSDPFKTLFDNDSDIVDQREALNKIVGQINESLKENFEYTDFVFGRGDDGKLIINMEKLISYWNMLSKDAADYIVTVDDLTQHYLTLDDAGEQAAKEIEEKFKTLSETTSEGISNLEAFSGIYKTITSSETSGVEMFDALTRLSSLMNEIDGGNRIAQSFMQWDESSGRLVVNLDAVDAAFSQIINSNGGLLIALETGAVTAEDLANAYKKVKDAAEDLKSANEKVTESMNTFRRFGDAYQKFYSEESDVVDQYEALNELAALFNEKFDTKYIAEDLAVGRDESGRLIANLSMIDKMFSLIYGKEGSISLTSAEITEHFLASGEAAREMSESVEESAETFTSTMAEGLNNLKSFSDIYKSLTDENISWVETVEALNKLASLSNTATGGDRTADTFMKWDDASQRLVVDFEAVQQAFIALILTNDELSQSVDSGILTVDELSDAYLKAKDATDQLESSTEKLSKALSNMQKFGSAYQKMFSEDSDIVDQVDALNEMAEVVNSIDENAHYTAEDFTLGRDETGKIVYNMDMILTYWEAIAGQSGSSLLTIEDLTKHYMMLREQVEKTKTASEKMSSAITTVTSGSKLVQSISDEIAESGYNSLDTVKDYIETVGSGFDRANDLMIDSNGNIKLTDAAIEKLHNTYNKLIDDYVDDPVLAKTLKDRIKATQEQIDLNKKLGESYEHVQKAWSNRKDLDHSLELTKDAYDELIAIDARYAEAVDYGSGRLTINAQKYDEVTRAIMRETEAQAAAGLQRLMADQEYQDLLSRQDSLNESELERLRNLNAEAMGYSVLINQLHNATSAYAEFLNAQTNVNASDFDAAGAAIKVIEDTLYNAESEMYGMIGRDQFKKALTFAIGLDYDDAQFKETFDRIKGYFAEGSEGVNKFLADLRKADVVDAGGQLNMGLDGIAKKMGMTVDGVAAMLNQYNQYADEAHQIKFEMPDVEGATDPLQTLQSQLTEVMTAKKNIEQDGLTIDTSPAVKNINSAASSLESLMSLVNKLAGKVIDIYVKIHQNGNTITSGNPASTLANTVNGLTGRTNYAMAGGGAAAGGRTLVGELGREMVVDPHKNKWYTVGDKGAEFVTLPKDAIVFNHFQTRQLLNAGKSGRGASMASGNAMALANSRSVMSDAGSGSKTAKAVGNLVDNLKAVGNVLDQIAGANNTKKGGGNKGKSLAKQLEELKKKYEELDKETEHLIRHQEHLYNVAHNALDFKGMDASLTEQIRLYKKKMADAQNAVQEMLAAGATDTNEEVQAMEEVYWSAYDNLYDKLGELNKLYVDGLNDKIDGLQTAYKNLHDAMDEFNSSGGISLDTFQGLLDHGTQYLSLLEKQNGQYAINEDGIQKMMAAEKDQLAVEQALAYLGQIRQALADNDSNLLANLVNVTEKVGDSTWNVVDAQLAAMKNAGLTADQYQIVYNNIQAIRDLAGNVLEESYEGSNSLVEVIDDLLKKTEELIKYETKKHIEAIKEEVNQYKEIIKLKKESLKTTKDEDDYQKSIGEKVEEIVKLQARLDQLALDDSRDARAQAAKLREDLVAAQDELNDLQNDHAYDAQTEALDKMSERYEEVRQEEIDALEESISSAEKLYRLALDRIENGWDTLFNDLIAWNTAEGNSLNSEIVETWEAAAAAVEKYGSYINALAHYKELKGTHLETIAVPQYHSGGVVGGAKNLKDNETMAVLKKGELVLNEKAKKGIYTLMEFPDFLAEKIGLALDKVKNFFLPANNPAFANYNNVSPSVATATGSSGMVFSPTINVELNHSGAFDAGDAGRYGRTIAKTALDELAGAFNKTGITRSAVNKRIG